MQATDENEMHVDRELSVVTDNLPTVSHTISWSNSILSDGSCYQVPKATQFAVAEEGVVLEAQF